MTKHYALQAEARTTAGKGAARALRREGKIPAVIYGDKKDPVGITLPLKEATLEYHKGHMFTTLCDIAVGKDKVQVLARDVQVHPVTDVIEHIDFLRVSDNTKLTVNVPVQIENYEGSKAAVGKGILNMVRHDVEIVCLAKNIPDNIVVDLSKAEIGDIVKISNVELPKGAKPAITDRDFTILTIVAPKTAAASADDEAAPAAEDDAAPAEDAAE